MRGKRLILTGLVVLGLTPGTWWRSQLPPKDYHAGLALVRLPAGPATFGPFTLAGVWHLSSSNDHFGGYSALLARPGGQMLAGSDAGRLLAFPRPDAARGEVIFGQFAGSSKRDKRASDLESLTQNPASGVLWGGYEGSNAIVRYRDPASAGTAVHPREMAGWGGNSGPEAMVRLEDGRFIVLAEQRSRFGGDSHEALLFARDPVEGGEPAVFRVTTPGGLRPVDMTLTPDGRVLILLRAFRLGLPPYFEVALAMADPAEIKAGENWEIKLVAQLSEPAPSENYEGLALAREADGTCSVWLISDDNFSVFQRTLLLKLRWDACGEGASAAP